MKRGLVTVVVVAAIVVACLWAAPFLAARDLKAALEAGDAERLEARVDFPVLRESLKAQVQGVLRRGLVKRGEDDVLGAMATGLGALVVDRMIEAVVTPRGMAALARGEEPTTPGQGGGPAAERDPAEDLFHGARHRRDSFDRFSIHVPTDGGRQVAFVLGRYGLGWKLRDIRLPLD